VHDGDATPPPPPNHLYRQNARSKETTLTSHKDYGQKSVDLGLLSASTDNNTENDQQGSLRAERVGELMTNKWKVLRNNKLTNEIQLSDNDTVTLTSPM